MGKFAKSIRNLADKAYRVSAFLEQAEAALYQYGYLRNKDPEEAIREFQEFYGLPQTGRLDWPTIRATQASRCGMPDYLDDSQDSHKRYAEALHSPIVYPGKETTVCVVGALPGVSSSAFRATVMSAANEWRFDHTIQERVCDVQFVLTEDERSADVRVIPYDNRSDGFGRPNGVLADAELNVPGLKRQQLVRVDTAENWTDSPGNQFGIWLWMVMLHEWGHVLGLSHQMIRRIVAVLNPTYNPVLRGLQEDDRRRAFQLFPFDRSQPEPEPPATTPEPQNPRRKISSIIRIDYDNREVTTNDVFG